MGVFDDKKYEALDWISQAVEPFENTLVGLLNSMPAEFTFSYDDFIELNKINGSNVYGSEVFSYVASKYQLKANYNERNKLEKYFELRVAENTTIDLVNRKILGSLIFVKVKEIVEEADIISMLGKEGNAQIGLISYSNDTTGYESRLNEIAELIGCDKTKNTKKIRSKVKFIEAKMEEIMQDNKWNLRSIDLSNKVGIWICSYVGKGNIAALMNLCKLKVMTHKGLPIYSVEEEV